MARILIAGCGDVGTSLGKALVEKGHYVVGLRRHPLLTIWVFALLRQI